MADTFAAYFARERSALESGLSACIDTVDAEDCARLYFDKMQHAFALSERDEAKREFASELFGVARAAIACMLSVTDAEIFFHASRAEPTHARLGEYKAKWERYLPYIAPGLCALTALAAMLGNQGALSALAWLAAGASGYQSWHSGNGRTRRTRKSVAAALPEASATPRANTAELVRRLERLAIAMDTAMERAFVEDNVPALPESLSWTGAQLEAVQMLWEASMQHDGEYALKTVPQLVLSLEKAGIKPELYSAERTCDFDKLPGLQDGYTVRPALYMGDKLIMRGQATQAMARRSVGA